MDQKSLEEAARSAASIRTTYYGPKPEIGEPIAIYLSELEGLPLIVVTKQSDISKTGRTHR